MQSLQESLVMRSDYSIAGESIEEIMDEQPTSGEANLNIAGLAADIVCSSSFFSTRKLSVPELPSLISQIHAALTRTVEGKAHPDLQTA
jgi:predicted transcriptional regulator